MMLLRAERCELILRIQAEGLARAYWSTPTPSALLWVFPAGWIPAWLCWLPCAPARCWAVTPRTLLPITMPCFGTTKRTRSNAEILCEALGVSFTEINITNTVESHFADIGQDPHTYDVTFENCQARVRTLELMDYANKNGGFVIGTGDLSELALGWATYNGDHMSMYGVNAGVPKTLVRHIVQHVADDLRPAGACVMCCVDILDTPVSPELLPSATDGDHLPSRPKSMVGPLRAARFLTCTMCCALGFRPAQDLSPGRWPHLPGGYADGGAAGRGCATSTAGFSAQQFKRSCLPDGPKVGSVTLSPARRLAYAERCLQRFVAGKNWMRSRQNKLAVLSLISIIFNCYRSTEL